MFITKFIDILIIFNVNINGHGEFKNSEFIFI